MNKIYKVIWSKVRNCYVAVSEIAKRNGKSCTSVNCGAKANRGHAGMALSAAVGATLLAGVCSVLLPVRVALAAPVMPTLDVNGKSAAVTIASTSSATSATMNINSTQTNNVLKWIDFSIGKGGAVNFTDEHNYLNYVTGHGRSEIDGTLTGAGNIYLINPNGILFGSNASVNVGNLYLSTRRIDDETLNSFNNNNSEAMNPLGTTASSAAGDIINLGRLNANNITVEGNNISFKNVEEVTPTTAVNVRASGEVHVGYAASEEVNEVNSTQYTDGHITRPDAAFAKMNVKQLNGTTSIASGKYTEYMLVRNAYELQNMQNKKTLTGQTNSGNTEYYYYNIDGNYMLANDIEFEGTSFNDVNSAPNTGFRPIGYTADYTDSTGNRTNTDYRFSGNFDGLNFKISNLKITEVTLPSDVDRNIGLFGYNIGTIENVGVVNTSIDVSGITNKSGEEGQCVGGIVGWNRGSNAIIRNVYHTGSVKGKRGLVGGIVGQNYGGSVENAYNTGDVDTINETGIGGIAGDNSNGGTITNVYNTGDIGNNSRRERVGGIVGKLLGGTIKNAYNTGAVKGSSDIGGIVGYSGYNNTIENTYNVGTATKDTELGGGIVGTINSQGGSTTISASYFSKGDPNNVLLGTKYVSNSDDMKKAETFSAWNTTTPTISATGGAKTTWRIIEGQTTPQLTAFLKTKDYINKRPYDGNADFGEYKNVGTYKNVDSNSKPVTTHQVDGLSKGFDYVQDVSVIEPKELLLVADKISIKKGEGSAPDPYTGTITGFVPGETWDTSDTLTFELTESAPTMAGSYEVIGKLNGEESGKYRINDSTPYNYIFKNDPSNAGAFSIVIDAMPKLDFKGASPYVTIASTPDTMNISSLQTNNVLKWMDFSIDKDGTVNFDTNNYLNYVTGHGRSEIDGTLTGGGNIYLINPNGMVFGSTAQVNVGNLYLSTRRFDIDDLKSFDNNSTEAMNPLSTTVSSATGDIVNLGTLTAANITAEGNNISFKNVKDVSVTGTDKINVRASGEVHVGYANTATATTEINYTGYYVTVNEPNLTLKWNFTGLDQTTAVSPVMYMLVRNASELQNMQSNLTGNYMLANDIDASGIEHFQPIGSDSTSGSPTAGMFQGRLDGLNYEIQNIKIDSNDNAAGNKYSNIGIIGSNAGIIENLHVTNGTVNVNTINSTNTDSVGGIVGANKAGAIIRNVSFSGSVTGRYRVGGIAGFQNGTPTAGTIEKAYNQGTIQALSTASDDAGGIVGYNGGYVREVYNSGKVSGEGKSIGGIVGLNSNSGKVEYAYNTGAITGKNQIGGIVGRHDGGKDNINFTYNTGVLTGSSYIGDILGTGGKASNSYFSNGYYDANGDIQTATQDLKAKSTFSLWGDDNITAAGGAGKVWRIYEGQTTPLLTAFLKTKDVITETEYNGTARSFDENLVTGDIHIYATNGGVYASETNAGKHEGLTGDKVLYSDQLGYDLVDKKLIIQPKRVSLVNADKTYDGTKDVNTSTLNLNTADIIGSDSAKVTLVKNNVTGTYADKNVGDGKAITYTIADDDGALTGNAAGNYIISAAGTGNITAKTLNLVSVSKVYDGTANVEAGDIALATGIIDGDDAEFNSSNVTGLYEDENVNVSGSKAVTYTINTGALTRADAGNYIIATAGTGDITPRTVTLDGTISKVYDGTNTATPTVNALSNVIEADKAALSISATSATYSDVNVGNNLTVTYEGLQLGGTKAGNYAIASTGANVPGNSITPKELTATFNTISKIYDGGTSGTANASLTGVVGSDDVSVTATATYAGQDVGTWDVNYTGIGLKGNQAGNYVLDSTSAADKTVEGNSITAKSLTVGNISKVYDGTAEAKLTLDNLIGLVDGDKTSLSISEGVTANYTGENAADFGAGKIVEYSGLTLGGEKSGNYTIAVNGTTTGNIDKRVLTAKNISKVYDGTDTATLHLSDLLGTDGLPGVVERDETYLDLTTSPATYGNKDAGIDYNVTFSDISLTGSLTGDKSHNYTINGSITVQGTITRKALELVAKEVTIRENEQIPSSFDGSIIGFIAGEGLANNDTLVFSLANPMTTPVVGSYRIVGKLNGAESGDYGLNYTFQNAASNATAFTVKPILAVLPALDFRGASVWAASVNVTIDKSKENKLLIDSTKLYNTLKWIDFSIGENGTVQFDDKNYLNYVTGHGRSDIDGTLTGGGAIYLINPNGVLFGSTAQVNVGNLYVSSRTLDIAALKAFETNDTNDTNDTNPLETPPVSAAGNIINRGKLKAAGITVEGNNVSFKNYADVTATGGIKVRADGEVHVGFSYGEEAAAVNDTEYKTVSEPELANWDFKKTDNTTEVTPEKYMLVRNAYELQNMKNNLLGNYMLANDIEFKNENGGYIIGQFIPIGSLGGWTDYKEGMFKGKLDGLYHVIKDIYIDNTAITQNSNRLTDIGIIGSNAGIVENLGVINGNVNITNSGASAVGGIVGANKPGGIIRNVYFSGSVKGGRTGTGGVAGWQNVRGLTENAYATGTVTSSYSNNPDSILGVIGVTGGSIKNAYFSGIVRNNNMNELYKSDGTRKTLTDPYSMKQFATFNSDGSDGAGWDITADGSKNATWRIYEGKTTPLLTAFLKTKSLVTETEYDGTEKAFDQTLVTGNSQVNELNSAAYSAKETNAGVYDETKTFYSDSQQGYNIVDTKLVIQPKTLTLVNSKTYDGTTNTKGTIGFTGKIGNDNVSLIDGSVTGGIYADKNVGANKAVTYTIADSTLGGTNKANYILTVKGTGTITPKAITATFDDIIKVYDGTINDVDENGAAVTSRTGTLTGVVEADTGKVSVTGKALYADKNAGTEKTVNYSDVALGGGETEDESANYVLSSTSATGKGKIDKREISVAFGDISKTYDGLTTSDTIGARTFTN
ncbi:filamentous hemagglutinin family N-terminal domain-containing protein, partial [Succiniclasticum ruminis]